MRNEIAEQPRETPNGIAPRTPEGWMLWGMSIAVALPTIGLAVLLANS